MPTVTKSLRRDDLPLTPPAPSPRFDAARRPAAKKAMPGGTPGGGQKGFVPHSSLTLLRHETRN